jgi:hypothetical protein
MVIGCGSNRRFIIRASNQSSDTVHALVLSINGQKYFHGQGEFPNYPGNSSYLNLSTMTIGIAVLQWKLKDGREFSETFDLKSHINKRFSGELRFVVKDDGSELQITPEGGVLRTVKPDFHSQVEDKPDGK